MAFSAIAHLLARTLSLQMELGKVIEEGNQTSTTLDYLRYQSEMLYEHAVCLSPLDNYGDVYDNIILKLREVFTTIRDKDSSIENSSSHRPGQHYSGNCGRPKFIISQEQLEYLMANGFNAADIGRMLGVSLSTVRRRMKEYGINTSRPFSDLSDDDLIDLLRETKKECPRSGYRMMLGYLRARGYRVPQLRVRQMLRKQDPEGTVIRWMSTVHRRVYSVSGSNALWQIDGNHKLIR